MELVIDARKHLEMHGATTSTMPETEYVNCARCTKSIGVTNTYKARMDAKHIPILCNDYRNMSEQEVTKQ